MSPQSLIAFSARSDLHQLELENASLLMLHALPIEERETLLLQPRLVQTRSG